MPSKQIETDFMNNTNLSVGQMLLALPGVVYRDYLFEYLVKISFKDVLLFLYAFVAQ